MNRMSSDEFVEKNPFTCEKCIHTQDILKSLQEYDWSEEYDPKKTYIYKQYTTDYGFGPFRYTNILITFINEAVRKRYVVAMRTLTDDEIEAFEKHCQCQRCSYYFFDPRRFFVCPCCVGCMASPFPSQAVVRKTAIYLEKKRGIDPTSSLSDIFVQAD